MNVPTTRQRDCRFFLFAMMCLKSVSSFATGGRNNHALRFTTSAIAAATNSVLELMVPTQDDMLSVGALLGSLIWQEGEASVAWLGLDGDLGAGKTVLARGFVRAWTGDVTLRVTSPTYLLSHSYKRHDRELRHLDLYRLQGLEREWAALDWERTVQTCCCLVEWPERLPELPSDRLDVTLQIIKQEETEDEEEVPRLATLRAHGPVWLERLERIRQEGYLDDLLHEPANHSKENQ